MFPGTALEMESEWESVLGLALEPGQELGWEFVQGPLQESGLGTAEGRCLVYLGSQGHVQV